MNEKVLGYKIVFGISDIRRCRYGVYGSMTQATDMFNSNVSKIMDNTLECDTIYDVATSQIKQCIKKKPRYQPHGDVIIISDDNVYCVMQAFIKYDIIPD